MNFDENPYDQSPSQVELFRSIKAFAAADQLRDGVITQQEFPYFSKSKLPLNLTNQLISMCDRDDDNVLSCVEFCLCLILHMRLRSTPNLFPTQAQVDALYFIVEQECVLNQDQFPPYVQGKIISQAQMLQNQQMQQQQQGWNNGFTMDFDDILNGTQDPHAAMKQQQQSQQLFGNTQAQFNQGFDQQQVSMDTTQPQQAQLHRGRMRGKTAGGTTLPPTQVVQQQQSSIISMPTPRNVQQQSQQQPQQPQQPQQQRQQQQQQQQQPQHFNFLDVSTPVAAQNIPQTPDFAPAQAFGVFNFYDNTPEPQIVSPQSHSQQPTVNSPQNVHHQQHQIQQTNQFNEQIIELNKQHEINTQTISNLRNELSDQSDAHLSASITYSEKKALVEQEEAKIAELNHQISIIQNHIKRIENDIDNADASCEQYKLELPLLSEMLENITAEVEEKQAIFQTKMTDNAQAHQQLTDLQAEVGILDHRKQFLDEQLDIIANLEHEISIAVEIRDSKQQEYDVFEAKHAEKLAMLEQYNDKLARLQKECLELDELAQTTKKNMELLDQQNAQKNVEIRENYKRYDTIVTQLTNAQLELERQRLEIEQCSEKDKKCDNALTLQSAEQLLTILADLLGVSLQDLVQPVQSLSTTVDLTANQQLESNCGDEPDTVKETDSVSITSSGDAESVSEPQENVENSSEIQDVTQEHAQPELELVIDDDAFDAFEDDFDFPAQQSPSTHEDATFEVDFGGDFIESDGTTTPIIIPVKTVEVPVITADNTENNDDATFGFDDLVFDEEPVVGSPQSIVIEYVPSEGGVKPKETSASIEEPSPNSDNIENVAMIEEPIDQKANTNDNLDETFGVSSSEKVTQLVVTPQPELSQTATTPIEFIEEQSQIQESTLEESQPQPFDEDQQLDEDRDFDSDTFGDSTFGEDEDEHPPQEPPRQDVEPIPDGQGLYPEEPETPQVPSPVVDDFGASFDDVFSSNTQPEAPVESAHSPGGAIDTSEDEDNVEKKPQHGGALDTATMPIGDINWESEFNF